MTLLYILHPQRDEVIAILDSEGENTFWSELHVRDLRTLEDKFTFMMRSNSPASSALLPRCRILVPAETKGFNEFILFRAIDKKHNMKSVVSVASYTDIERGDNIISPGIYEGSINELMQIALPGTRYKPGYIEFSGFAKIEIKEYTKPYTFIKKISSTFKTELNFRIELKDNQITGRYVDHLRRIGEDTDKELSIGKDLLNVEITTDSDAAVTGLFCVGPERADGTRLTTLVTNEAAFQRWNVDGAPLIDIYYPDSTRQDMTLEELKQYGTTELEKRINTVMTYRFEAAILEDIYPHERMALGDRIRVVENKMMPALYARARIVRVERPLSKNRKKVVEIGEVKRYSADELRKQARRVYESFGVKLIHSATAPVVRARTIWVQESNEVGGAEVAHIAVNGNWQPITPTDVVETNKNYNGWEFSPEDGLTITRTDELVRILLNATGGIRIQRRETLADPFEDMFYANTSGGLTLVGDIDTISRVRGEGGAYYGDAGAVVYGYDSSQPVTSYSSQGVSTSNSQMTNDAMLLSIDSLKFFSGGWLGESYDRYLEYGNQQMALKNPSGTVLSGIQPNANGTITVKGEFVTNQPETSWMAGSCINAASVENGSLNGVHFKVKKTYVPSSIAFTSVNSNATPNFYDISVDGFTFGVPSLGANTLKFIRGRYLA